jgi:two-component system chemotaxis sensor kinase CheA
MARGKFTLDDAALLLVQLEPEDAAGLKQLRDRLRRLARDGSLSGAAVHEIKAAADALTAGLKADAAGAIVAAGDRIEAAMLAVEDALDGPSSASAEVVVPSSDAGETSQATDALASSAAAVSTDSPAGIDPLMLAALAELESEEAPTDDGVGGEATAVAAAPLIAFDPDEAPAALAGEMASAAEPASSAPAEVSWSPDADPELLEGFVAESGEYLQKAESALLELEADPTSTEAVNTVFRCFHTIKGTSAFLGLERVSELAHRAESLMSRVRDREIRLEGGYAELALRSIDVLTELVRAVGAALAGRPAIEPAGYAALYGALADPEAALARMALEPGAASALGAMRTVDPAAAVHADAVEAWMRVRTDRLDRLVDTIGELVIAHSMIAQDGTVTSSGNEVFGRKVTHASKIVRELQDLSISMRMVPLKGTVQKLARVVRDAAAKSGKQIEFATDGEETEIDRNMVELIADPLVHMIRNAVDHGIELPADREAAGKPRRGTIHVSARHAGGSVVITLTDDGRGLDRAKILDKAIEKGLVESDRGLNDRDLLELIFAPGFSTADKVTDLSGRGVGMDVVRRNIEELRGRIDIESEPGAGSSFSIRLPLTLAITDGMLVRIGSERYILPTVNIQMSFQPEREMLSTVAGRGEIVLLRGDVLPIVRLHRMLGVEGAETDATRGLLVIVGSGERRTALLVDELLGQQQLVAKSLGEGLGRVPGISGGAILGDGRVGLILDVAEIMAISRQNGSDAARVAA